MAWGKRVHKKLEYYRMPSTLCSERGWKRKPMNPIFFAPYEIQPGGLTEELQERLKASKNLIVICSPNSAKSEWVGKEIEYFHKLGRTNQIHFFIVEGKPNSGNPETECYNPIVKILDLPEILGANIHEKIYRWPWMNKERAYVQLITKLLGVEFNTIWQRHKRILIRKTLTGISLFIVVLALFYIFAMPLSLKIHLHDEGRQLPSSPNPELIIFDSHYPLNKLDTVIALNLSGYLKLKRFEVHFKGQYYCDINYPVIAGANNWKEIDIQLRRDSTYAVYAGKIVDSQGVPVRDAIVTIDKQKSITDKNGSYYLIFPVDQQDTSKILHIYKEGYKVITTDQIPYKDAAFILFKQ